METKIKYLNFDKKFDFRGNHDYPHFFKLNNADIIFTPRATMTFNTYKALIKKTANFLGASEVELLEEEESNSTLLYVSNNPDTGSINILKYQPILKNGKENSNFETIEPRVIIPELGEKINKEQIMTEADQKKLNRVNQLINEKAELQKDGTLRISSEDWRGINRELNKANIEKNKLFEDAIRRMVNEETAAMQKQSESPPLERRNINSKENFMSSSREEYEETGEPMDEAALEEEAYEREEAEALENENKSQARNPREEAMLNAAHQRKVIADAAKAGKLSCLPGADGFADTSPAVSLAKGKFYHGSNLLFLKAHQKENGFPSAEYVTAGMIDKARKDKPDLFIRKGQKGVSIYVNEMKEETGEYESKHYRLFNVAQLNKPAAMKEWIRQERLEYLQSQYGKNYQLPEPTQKQSGPEIVCSSTEPKEYLGQYFAAVSMGGKFKASKEQAAEFAQKLETALYEKMTRKTINKDTGEETIESVLGKTGEPVSNPFSHENICIEASQYCREFMRNFKMEAQKAETPQQQQEQTQSPGFKR